jgi:hypothetical protein
MTVLARSLAALCILAAPLQAHEFWIEAESYVVPSGGAVTATLRNGELLTGVGLSYLPTRTRRHDYVAGGSVAPIPARIGDNPAIALEGLPDGLVTLIHETAPLNLTYDDWAAWTAFTDQKDLAWGQAAHRARGLPEDAVRERYMRFAKALVAVGDGRGADAERGLRTEIVAEANPYTDDLSAGLPVRVLLDGRPRAGAQVEMFARAPDGDVRVTTHLTDAEGRAVLPVVRGYDYLLDSVTLLPLNPQAPDDPAWLTLWAALTFSVVKG